jgi:hypothetical protein
MTYDQLKANYTAAYRIIMRERAMRDRVFAKDAEKREEKIAEMDKLLELIDDLKNELKKHIAPETEQPRLIDVAPRYEY